MGIIGAIINFVAALLGFVPKGPSTDQQLGQVEQELKDVQASDAATAAGNAAAGNVTTNADGVFDGSRFERPGS